MDFLRLIFGKPKSTAVEKDDTTAATAPAQPESQEKSETLPVREEEETSRTDPGKTAPFADGVTRQLSPEPLISSRNGHITFGQSTDKGMVRSNNQDACLTFLFTSKTSEDRPDFGIFIVADGMGGHHDGEKAAALTARTVATQITRSIYLPMIMDDDDDERPTIAEALTAAAQKANSLVIKEVPDGGTTLTAVAVVGDLAHIVHVGDSRVYLISRGEIEQITRDHSLVQRLIELNQLTPDQASDHPQKNVLYRAIGQNDALEVDTLTRRLPADARLLVCSDGLWGIVSEKQILDVVVKHPDPQEACDRLVAIANMNGGTDNITAILLRIPGK